jgi:hypothetical protein
MDDFYIKESILRKSQKPLFRLLSALKEAIEKQKQRLYTLEEEVEHCDVIDSLEIDEENIKLREKCLGRMKSYNEMVREIANLQRKITLILTDLEIRNSHFEDQRLDKLMKKLNPYEIFKHKQDGEDDTFSGVSDDDIEKTKKDDVNFLREVFENRYKVQRPFEEEEEEEEEKIDIKLNEETLPSEIIPWEPQNKEEEKS